MHPRPLTAGSVTSIVVFFQSEQSIVGCVRSLLAQQPYAPEVVVVANSPLNMSLASFLFQLGVRTLTPPGNLGFGAGCNAGVAASPEAEYFWLVNPDVQCSPGTLASLLPHARRGHVAGPLVLNSAGEPERSTKTMRYLSPWVLLARELVVGRWLHLGSPQPPSFPTPVDILSGSCLLLRADTFRSIGGFDERFFLYGEDVDLCCKLAARNIRRVFEPAATVYHASGTGAGGPRSSLEILRIKGIEARRSHALLLQKWRGDATMVRYLRTLRVVLSLRLLGARLMENRAEQVRALSVLEWLRSPEIELTEELDLSNSGSS